MKNKIFRIIFVVLFAFLLYYFMLPPIHATSPIFWTYLLFIYVAYLVTGILNLADLKTLFVEKITIRPVKKVKSLIPYLIIPGVILIILLINFIESPVLRSKTYYNRIKISSDGNFTEDVKQVDFNTLPLLDKNSSQKLGDRVMGQLPELVSQFYVSDLCTQINYNNNIARVTPLEYNGFIKYLTNRKDGVKGYIVVNSVTGESSLSKLENGMKYMPSAYFFENLYRKLRFDYPFEIFGAENFEIDNEGKPYWVVPTIRYSGVGLREEITGVIILDPVTGESAKYSVGEVPTWIDHVYSADLIIEQVDDWGLYKNGFFNSIFGQKMLFKQH